MVVERLLSGLALPTDRAAARARFKGLATRRRRAVRAIAATPAGRAAAADVPVVGAGVRAAEVVEEDDVVAVAVGADKIKSFWPGSLGEHSGGFYDAWFARKV